MKNDPASAFEIGCGLFLVFASILLGLLAVVAYFLYGPPLLA